MKKALKRAFFYINSPKGGSFVGGLEPPLLKRRWLLTIRVCQFRHTLNAKFNNLNEDLMKKIRIL